MALLARKGQILAWKRDTFINKIFFDEIQSFFLGLLRAWKVNQVCFLIFISNLFPEDFKGSVAIRVICEKN